MPGVYISYPFCTQKCSFCNFASDVAGGPAKDQYATALLAEIRRHHWDWAPETLYFGGGTPSLMPDALLEEILSAIPQSQLAEVTMECAPGTATEAKIQEWVRAGVNRVSLGVQSFVAEELRQTGRRHSAEIVAREVGLLRDNGIASFNIDLIAGLPGQTRQSWSASLDWLERLRPPHVSIYLFEVDEDSRLGREVLLGGTRYGAALVPSDELAAELYETAVERLAAIGIDRYEISNFAAPGFESRHNLKYWLLEPYVGFGLDAASFDGRLRRTNPETLESYLHGVSEPAIEGDPGEEHFFVGLRLSSGIEPTAEEWERFSGPIAKWTAGGMLEQQGPRLKLSNKGVLLSNEIFQDFLV